MARSYISRLSLRVGTVAVAGDSMAPTYKDGDWLIARWGAQFKVGQVLVIEREDRPGIFLIKRLIRIENGKYWVEGDNKVASTDSRQWGFVSAEEVIGHVLFRYRRSDVR